MKNKKIVIVGSSNMDMVVKAERIPEPGETVLSGDFFMNPGGKGANQAVAVARLGGEAVFVSKTGNDVFGKQFIQLFQEEGIDTAFVLSDEETPSGVALITVDKSGENSIVVASGANARLGRPDLENALGPIAEAAILLVQLEIPMDTVRFVIRHAAEKGVRVILNPAPVNLLPAELLKQVDILTPNRMEAGMMAGIRIKTLENAKKAARIIHERGVQHVVVTMGPLGAVLCRKGQCITIAAPQVAAVDSTAAGDVFNGALAVAVSEGKDLPEAVAFACKAAALSVTRLGAQSSIPYRTELVDEELVN